VVLDVALAVIVSSIIWNILFCPGVFGIYKVYEETEIKHGCKIRSHGSYKKLHHYQYIKPL
jgi:Ca2+/Na+ antiporter